MKQIVRLSLCLALFAVAARSFAADQVLFSAGPATKWVAPRGKVTVAPDGTISIKLPAMVRLHQSQEFKFPADGRCLILGEIRTLGAEGRPYIGLAGRTADGRAILSTAARRISPLFGTVTAEVKPTDTSVVLSGDLEKWGSYIRRAPHYYLAFGVKADKSDLPNFDLSPAIKVDGFTRQPDGSWKCEFAKPIGRAVPAGTAAGLHFIGSSYPYAVIPPCEGEWKQISGTFARNGVGGAIPVFAGTDRTGLVIFSSSKKGTLEIRNLAIIME